MPFIDLNPGFASGTPPGDATVTFDGIFPAATSVGDVVYISGDKIGSYYQVDKADIYTIIKMPAIGVIIQKYTSTTGRILCSGEVTGIYAGLTPGKMLFVNAASRLDEAAPGSPTTGIVNVQPLAYSLSSDTIFLKPESPTRRVSG